MAKNLYDMTQDEAIAYLREMYGKEPVGAISDTADRRFDGSAQEGGTYYALADYTAPGGGVYRPAWSNNGHMDEAGYMAYDPDPAPENRTYTRQFTPSFDPQQGGTFGHYEGVYDANGNLTDVKFQKDERHQGWWDKHFDVAAPAVFTLLSGGLASGAFGLPAAGEGALGSAAVPNAVADLGELGFNTSLPYGTAGAPGGASPWLSAAADVGDYASLNGFESLAGDAGSSALPEAAAEGATQGAGTTGMDFGAGYESTSVYNQAYTAAIDSGLSPELAQMAAETASGLEGTGMAMSDMVSSGVAAATDAAATGAVGAGGSIVGGGGAITAGMTGAGGAAAASGLDALWQGAKDAMGKAGITDLKTALQAGVLSAGVIDALTEKNPPAPGGGLTNIVTPYTFERTANPAAKPLTSEDAYNYLRGTPSASGQPVSTGEQKWFNDKFTELPTYNPVSGEQYYRDPTTKRLVSGTALTDAQKNMGLDGTGHAAGGLMALANGGQTDGNLGSYSDYAHGGRLLKGPGDGVSDSIPATINGGQPARLADGEFVVPARIVSELGNGSTDAGARKLYAMMDRIQKARRKTVGHDAVATDSKADKHLPA